MRDRGEEGKGKRREVQRRKREKCERERGEGARRSVKRMRGDG